MNLDKIARREPTSETSTESTKHKKPKLELQQKFMNEVIADGKVINDDIFWNYFKYKNPSFLVKYLTRAN